jgi:hypothetical protein
MNILSIGKVLIHTKLKITHIEESMLSTHTRLMQYDYIIIHGGDGSIRRVVNILENMKHHAKFILNPTGSFNVIAKLHRVPTLIKVLDNLSKNKLPKTKKHHYATLNQEVFLFSAGNMGDLQHILLAETLRFGILKKGMTKYVLSFMFLLPMHLILSPFMLLSSKRFFVFMPFSKTFKERNIHLENTYNLIELDGDILTIKASVLELKPAGYIELVHKL